MTALLVVLIIIIFILIIMLLRVGVIAVYSEDGICLKVKAACFRVQIIPGKQKSPEEGKRKKKKNKKRKEEQDNTEKKKGGNVKFFLSLVEDVINLLGRFKNRLSIDELTVWYMCASDDPASAALNFGRISAGLGITTALLENNFKIKKRDFRTAVSFEETEPWIYVKAEFSIAIWEILYIVSKPGYNVLKKYLAKTKSEKLAESETDER